MDALKSLFDIQAIDCWHDLVADGQELHCLLAPAQKQRPPAALAQSYQKSPLPSWPWKQSLLCVLYHKSLACGSKMCMIYAGGGCRAVWGGFASPNSSAA